MEWDAGTGQWIVSFPELEQDRVELGDRVTDWRWFGPGVDCPWPA